MHLIIWNIVYKSTFLNFLKIVKITFNFYYLVFYFKFVKLLIFEIIYEEVLYNK